MKRLTLVAIATLTTIFAGAQIQFGAKAGLNLATMNVSPSEPGMSIKMRTNFHVGGLVNIPLANNFSLQPELVFSGQGSKASSGGDDVTFQLSYINIPVLVKYKTASGFFAELGPQIGFLAGATGKNAGVSVDIKDQFNTVDFSGVIGIGFLSDINLGADVRYNYGFSNMAKDSGDQTVKNGVIQIGVFYMFGGGK